MDMYWVRQGSSVFVPVTQDVYKRAIAVGRGVRECFCCDAVTWVLERWSDASLLECQGGVMGNCPHFALVLGRVKAGLA